MNKQKHITMQMWADAGSFEKVARPGDSVDEEIVEQFRNSVPPMFNGRTYMQAGEPVAHVLSKELKLYAPVYTTFLYDENESLWRYIGDCFRHEKIPPEEKKSSLLY